MVTLTDKNTLDLRITDVEYFSHLFDIYVWNTKSVTLFIPTQSNYKGIDFIIYSNGIFYAIQVTINIKDHKFNKKIFDKNYWSLTLSNEKDRNEDPEKYNKKGKTKNMLNLRNCRIGCFK